MNIEELYDKYIDEPKRKRKLVPISERIKYSDIPDKFKKVFIIAVIFLSTVLALYLFNVITIYSFGFHLAQTGAILFVFYILKFRYCTKCSQKMFRQYNDSTVYFFCDECKTKIKLVVAVGD